MKMAGQDADDDNEMRMAKWSAVSTSTDICKQAHTLLRKQYLALANYYLRTEINNILMWTQVRTKNDSNDLKPLENGKHLDWESVSCRKAFHAENLDHPDSLEDVLHWLQMLPKRFRLVKFDELYFWMLTFLNRSFMFQSSGVQCSRLDCLRKSTCSLWELSWTMSLHMAAMICLWHGGLHRACDRPCPCSRHSQWTIPNIASPSGQAATRTACFDLPWTPSRPYR